MTVTSQASSLADGTTTFALPARQRWVAQHDPSGYIEGRQFVDVVVNEPFRTTTAWRHTHEFAPAGPSGDAAGSAESATLITDRIDTRVPARILRAAVAYRQNQLINDIDFLSQLPDSTPLTVAVTGARGLVGTALCAQLGTAGHTVIRLVRGDAGLGERHWNPEHPASDLLHGVDAVVHLAGEPIFGRFTEEKKQRILDSRVGPTAALARLAADSGVATFVSASAIGIYDDGFLAQVCRQWEAATHVDAMRTVNIRTGLALSGAGGLLPVLRASASVGLGARIGNGDFWMSWISLDDLTDTYLRALIDPTVEGAVDATAPNPVTNAEFSRILAGLLRRPAPLPIPALGPKLLLGTEGARELAMADIKVTPAPGTRFRYPHLTEALEHELGLEARVESDE
ncbi:MAG: TIGR01777 family oxidoreductase [Corynebacterium sp.]|nr:TIGR01777 family oxidoreductase [Corynebacterium sp.]MDY5786158.1 TIGR01777 family oxidoreductase [Corynebacterium sp.]